jgi:BirA family biotin operon repressor/biotin-[acetyl-CoA-carboxylase] ligase
MRLASEGAPAWTLVAAGHQTAGRGRAGRSWIDRPGRALLCSVVLRPDLAPDRLGLVSLAAGASMAEAASELSGRAVRCKWPNDLVLGEEKVGGILAESEISEGVVRHVVVGVGVNLEAPAGVQEAGALGDVDPERLLAGFLGWLSRLLERPGDVPGRWGAVADTLGRHVEAVPVEGDAVRGVAVDVDATGALVVDTDAGRVRVAVGDVYHVRVDRR